MMKPVEPEELSALLDDELTPTRAEEVRRAIARDESLARVYRRLAGVDDELVSYAKACQFSPALPLVGHLPALPLSIWPIALCLLAIDIAAKVLSFGLGIGIQLVALAFVIGWFLRLLLPQFRDEPWQIAQELRG